MDLGMYSVELERPDVEELFAAIRGYGFSQVQFSLASVLEEEMPREIPRETVERVAEAAKRNGVEIVAVNGTFNMIHPDAAVRREGIARFAVVAAAAQSLGCKIVTLCTGSRSREGMWRRHEDNDSDDAWSDLLETMEPVVSAAEEHDLVLGIECEASNVVSSPKKARRLLDELATERLKIIMDAANLFGAGEARKEKVRGIIGDAFDVLGRDIVLAHGKDIFEGPELHFTSAGRGIVDFDYFFDLLDAAGYRGGLILHGIKSEDEFGPSVAFIAGKLAAR